MLFLFGTKSSVIGQYPLPGVACVNCGTVGSVSIAEYSRYLHGFWVPLFPVGRRSVSVCAHCQQALSQAQWPLAYRQAASPPLRAPLTHYAGLLLVGAVVLLGLLVALFRGGSAKTGAGSPPPTATGPQAGDLYAIAAPTGHRYNLLRVVQASADSVRLQASTYQPRSLEALRQHPDSARLGAAGNPVVLSRAGFDQMQLSSPGTLVRP